MRTSDLPKTNNKEWLVSRWMSSKVRALKPDDLLVDAFEIMREYRIRHVPVLDKGKLVGIVSDRDVRQAMPSRDERYKGSAEFGKALMETPLSKCMSKKPQVVSSDASIQEASEIICREKIGALPVVDDGKLAGIITAEDLLWAYLDNTRDMEFEE